jgi:CheY-like chemotaxis protein
LNRKHPAVPIELDAPALGVFMDSASQLDSSEARMSARIAIVDDDPISTTLQQHLVSLLGHHAIVEADPKLAVDRAMNGEFDLILLDLNMPGMNGFETLRALRDREAAQSRSPLPVIAVTGYTSESDRLRCLMAGFAEQVSKPINTESFDLALRRALVHHGDAAAATAAGDPVSDADRLRETVRRLSDVKPADMGFGPTVMERFALRSQRLIEAIRQALPEHDAEQVASNARALKADADFLGVTRLSAMCARLEQLMLAQRWNLAEQALQDIEHEHQVVLAVLFESAR